MIIKSSIKPQPFVDGDTGLYSRSRTSRSRDGLQAFFERLGLISVSASCVSFTTLRW